MGCGENGRGRAPEEGGDDQTPETTPPRLQEKRLQSQPLVMEGEDVRPEAGAAGPKVWMRWYFWKDFCPRTKGEGRGARAHSRGAGI